MAAQSTKHCFFNALLHGHVAYRASIQHLVHGGTVIGPCDDQSVILSHITAHNASGFRHLSRTEWTMG